MNNKLQLLGLLLLLLIGQGLFILSSTGFFRQIENRYDGTVEGIMVPGAEDFAISRTDSFLIISSTDRAGYRDGAPQPSGLYMMDLRTKNRQLIKLTDDKMPMNPHGISMIQIDSNGYRVLAISHVPEGEPSIELVDPNMKHTIEEYILRDGHLQHIKTHQHDMIYHPNDVVAMNATDFYFTNDHGAKTKLGLMAEDYLGWGKGNVVFSDGTTYKEVDNGIAYANGINYDARRKLMFVASPRDMNVRVYDVKEDNTLDHVENVDCNTGVDNIEFAPDETLWIGCHPNLLHFAAYAKGDKEVSPSEIITLKYMGKGNHELASVYTHTGELMSAPTTAIPFGGEIYVGNVMDDRFIVLKETDLVIEEYEDEEDE